MTNYFKCLFTAILLFSTLLGKAQDEVAPLLDRLQKTKGIEKIGVLNELSVVFRKTNRYESMGYARQAFKLSVEYHFLPGEALAKKNEGVGWFFIGSNDSATICYTQALVLFTKIGDKTGMSACYNNLGLIAQETGKYEEALKYYAKSIEMDHKLGDETGVALTLENIADIYMYQGNARKALSITNQCIRIYMDQSYKPGLLASYINRGAEYEYLAQYEEAIRDQTKALQMARELDDKYKEIQANSNLGVAYWHMGKPVIAMKFLNTALSMSDETDDGYNIDNTLKTIAEIYTFQKQYAKSNEILLKILNRTENIENKRQSAIIMTFMGRNLLELNEIDKAMGYFSKSLEISIGLKAPYVVSENYRNLIHSNAILHNFHAADSLLDLYAETYAIIAGSDSISDKRGLKKGSTEILQASTSTSSEWLIAFSLMAVVILLSIIAFRDKVRKNDP